LSTVAQRRGNGEPMDTIPSLFARQAAAFAQQPLFFVKRDGAYRPITWHDAQSDVLALSTFLLSRQVKPGDRVLILSENRPEWGIADLATQTVGAWTVPIYPSLMGEELRVICADAHPIIGIASSTEQVHKLLEMNQSVQSLRLIVHFENVHVSNPLLIHWIRALEQGRVCREQFSELLGQRQHQLQPDDPATLIYTSGTTGEPKGVMLSHRNFLSNASASLQVIPVTAADRHLSFLPLCHVFERMAGWYLMLMAGASVAYAETMDTISQNMLEIHPTIMLGVPRFFEKLYGRIQEHLHQAPPVKRRITAWAIRTGQAVMAYRLAARRIPLWLALQHWLAQQLVFKQFQARLGGRLRFFVSGGAPLAKEIGEFFCSVGVTILEGYGLTETSPVITVNRLPQPHFGSVGQLLSGVDVSIAADGEILTRGPHVMRGYYKKPEATAAAIIDGWFHTGDIGRLDAGYLFITDRKKDLIKTAGGKFVSPQKLENLFITDPYISQAFVYGDKRPYCVALIVPNAEQLHRYATQQDMDTTTLRELVTHQDILSFYWERIQSKQQGLAGFEQVKKIALLDQEFTQASGELTPTLKAKRNAIAQRNQSLLDQLYQSAAS